jgi:hypothetical protein
VDSSSKTHTFERLKVMYEKFGRGFDFNIKFQIKITI